MREWLKDRAHLGAFLGYKLTSWATTNAHIKRIPGLSRNDQLWLRVTNIKAWLMMLTCRYTAEETSSVLLEIDLTWKCVCTQTWLIATNINMGKTQPISTTKCHYIKTSTKELPYVWYLEEICIDHNPVKQDSDQSKICADDNACRKYLFKLPTVRPWRWLNSILRDSHYGP